MDTLGGPMGPWDRWDLGTDGTWASRTPDTSSKDTSSKDTSSIPGPARPGLARPATPSPPQAAGATSHSSVAPAPSSRGPARLPGPRAGCRLPGRPFFGSFFRKNSKNCSTDPRDQNQIPKKIIKIQKKMQKTISADFRPFFFRRTDSSNTKSARFL